MNLEKLKDTARRFEQKEEWRKAIEVYLKAIAELETGREAHPDLTIYNRLGDLYLKTGDTIAAIRAYERLAELYTDQGFYNNAIALCGKILRLNPQRSPAYLRLAILHARKNVVIEAKRNLVAYMERMHAAGQLDEAFAAVRAAADAFAANHELRLMLVDLLKAASRENEARAELAAVADELAAQGEEQAAAEVRSTLIPIEVDYSQATEPLPPPVAPAEESVGAAPAAPAGLVFIDVDATTEFEVPPLLEAPTASAADGLTFLETDADGTDLPLITAEPMADLEGATIEPISVEAALDGLEVATLDGLEETALASDAVAADAGLATLPDLVATSFAPEADAAAAPIEGLEHPEYTLTEADIREPEAEALPGGDTSDLPLVELGIEHPETEAMDAPSEAPVEDESDVWLSLDEVPAEPPAAEAQAEYGSELAEVTAWLEEPAAAAETDEAVVTPSESVAPEIPTTEPEPVAALETPAVEVVAPVESGSRDEWQFDGWSEGGATWAAFDWSAEADDWAFDAWAEAPQEPEAVPVAAGHETAAVDAAPAAAEAVPAAEPMPVSDSVPDEGSAPAAASMPVVDAAPVEAVPETPLLDEALEEALVRAAIEGAPDVPVSSDVEDLAPVDTGAPTQDGIGLDTEDVPGADGEVSLEFEVPVSDFEAAPPDDAVRTLAESLQARIAEAPDDPFLHQRLAEALLELGDPEAAVEELALALDGYERGGYHDVAWSAAEQLVAMRPDTIRFHQKRVEVAFRLEDRPKLIAAYLALGDALVRNDAVDKALAVYRRVLDHDPANREAHGALETYEPRPRIPAPAAPAVAASAAPSAAPAAGEEAFVDLGALILDPEPERDTRMTTAIEQPTGDEQRDFEEALAAFKKGIEENLEDTDYEAHYDLGIAFKEMGLLDEAIAEFQKALRAPDGRLRTSEALGQAFFEKGQVAIAEAVLRRADEGATEGDDAKVGVLYWLGRALEQQGRTQDAVAAYQRAMAVDIRFADVGERLARLGAGGTA